ncbi:MAG: hypothetical protein ACOYVJ_07610 [Nitrospirota bacterium]
MYYTNLREYEDDLKVSESDSLYQNYYFRFEKSVTPLLSYHLNLRTTLTNTHTTDAEGEKRKDYLRAVEPALDLFFRHPVYGVEAGARRLEQWDTANLENDSRKTTEFSYARFTVRPYELPNLSVQLDRQRDYDHLSPRDADSTDTKLTGTSWYELLYRGLKVSYNVSYKWNENETPLNNVYKTVNNNLNCMYNIGYNKSLLNNRVSVAAGYQGNFTRNKTGSFAEQSGSIEVRRTPVFGQYGIGTQIQPPVDTLAPAPALTDGDYESPATTSGGTINIGQNGSRYHNIGILNESGKSVDALYLYVNKDVRNDMNLDNPANWRVYRSNTNLPNTWTEVSVQAITITLYDALQNIYRYEMQLTSAQDALYLKAVTMDTATISDVLVTEMEAWGRETFNRGKNTQITTFFTHGINVSATYKPVTRLSFSLNYYLNRNDQEPESVLGSIGGAFANMIRRLDGEKDSRLKSNVTRTYGASATWLTTDFLTTTARFQRNEGFDNRDRDDPNKTDIQSDSYSLTFSSSLLPTLDTNFSLIRTCSYSFDQKQSISDLVLLTIGSRLHREVNMITDVGYTKAKTYPVYRLSSTESSQEETLNTTWYIRGTLDARLSLNLTANLSYGLSFLSGTASGHSHDGTFIITYRPGRFISLSGNFRITDTDGNGTISEGAFVDWLMVPAVRINLRYEHRYEKAESANTHTLGGYVLWYVTKFIDAQLTYTYTLSDDKNKTETYNLGGNLTCRFW